MSWMYTRWRCSLTVDLSLPAYPGGGRGGGSKEGPAGSDAHHTARPARSDLSVDLWSADHRLSSARPRRKAEKASSFFFQRMK